MGVFEINKKIVSEADEEDLFKNDSYEQHWGDRIAKFNSEKRERDEIEIGLLRPKKVKGEGKATTSRRGCRKNIDRTPQCLFNSYNKN